MMLMKAPTGGATGTGFSREVIFRLSVQPDPTAAANAKAFGNELQKVQSDIAVTGMRRAKDMGDAYVRTFSTAGQAAIDFKTKGTQSLNQFADVAVLRAKDYETAWKRAADRTVENLNRVQGAGPTGVPGVGGGVAGGGIAGGGAMGGAGFRRSAEGFSNLLHGGSHMARGIAYSGLAGEDPQKVLDTLLKIEGTLGLIYGAVSIGKGLSSLGAFGSLGGGAAASGIAAPIAAFVAAVAGAALGINAIREQITGEASNPNSQSGMTGSGIARLRAWADRGIGGGDAATKAFNASIKREAGQQRYLGDQAKLRTSDASEFSRQVGMLSENSATRRRGHRGDAAERSDLQADLAEAKQLQELMSQGGVKSEQQAQQRKAIANQILDITQKIVDVDINGQREAAALALSRAENTVVIARQRMDAQGGLASSAAGRLRSDQVKFGSLSPLERMRTESAFMAMRSGRATREQEGIAGGYNAFGDQVEAGQAKRGQSPWFSELQRDADAATNDFQKRAAEVAATAKVVVDQRHEIILNLQQDDKGAADAAEQALGMFKEFIAAQDRETTRKLDDLRREMNAQQRNKQIIAGR